jgi:mRNA interferase RelE/StbE
MPWRVEISKRAHRDLAALNAEQREAVVAALRRMADDPSTVDLKKLQGGRGWRVRVGEWRVIAEMISGAGVIRVARVLSRRDAYRD